MLGALIRYQGRLGIGGRAVAGPRTDTFLDDLAGRTFMVRRFCPSMIVRANVVGFGRVGIMIMPDAVFIPVSVSGHQGSETALASDLTLLAFFLAFLADDVLHAGLYKMVGEAGIEPATSSLSRKRSSH